MNETVYYREKNCRFFIAEMSNGRKIKVDPEEVPKVVEAIRTGNIVKVRQGILNPSYLTAVVEDEARVKEFIRQQNEVKQHNEQDRKYNEGKNQRTYKGMEQLRDIFADVPKLKAANRKQLTERS